MLRLIRRYTINALRDRPVFSKKQAQCRNKIFRREGQVAFVLILLAAIGLVFYAITMNINAVANQKNTTMVAAQQSSAFMGSFLASYAQKLSEEYVQGGIGFCKKSSLFKTIMMAICTIIIVIIGIILAPFTGGGSLAFAYKVVIVMAIVFSVGAVVIDMVYVQPKITEMWNEMMQTMDTFEDKVIEYGIQSALQTAVDDNVQIPDMTDFDRDGIYGWDGGPPFDYDKVKDFISRFGYHYTLRMMEIKPTRNIYSPAIREFTEQLEDFVYFFDKEREQNWQLLPGGSVLPGFDIPYLTKAEKDLIIYRSDSSDYDLWGVHDSYIDNPNGHVCQQANPPAECDPGCLPAYKPCCEILKCPEEVESCTKSWPDPGAPAPDDPECCGSCSEPFSGADPHPSCIYGIIPEDLQSAGCEDRSYMSNNYQATTDLPSGSYNTVNWPGYPYVYDPHYEDTSNNLKSLREDIGKDDQSPFHQSDPEDPDWHRNANGRAHMRIKKSITMPDIQEVDNKNAREPDDYIAADTTGFWKGDFSSGIFPFFYVIDDIGVMFPDNNNPNAFDGFKCYWKADACDPSTGGMGYYGDVRKKGTGDPFYPIYSWTAPAGVPGIVLADWTIFPYKLSGKDEVGDLGTWERPDIVPDPDKFFMADDDCVDIASKGWKRGSDSFCSLPEKPKTGNGDSYIYNYPYNIECRKHGFNPTIDPPSAQCQYPSEMDESGNVIPPMDRDCSCGETGSWEEKYFPQDNLDNIVFTLEHFLTWAKGFLETIEKGGAASARKTMSQWFDGEAAQWLEEPCEDATCQAGDTACCQRSFTKRSATESWGLLYQTRDEFQWFYNQLKAWIFPDSGDAYIKHTCFGPDAAFCIPASRSGIYNEYGEEECGGISSEEARTFDVQAGTGSLGDGVRGDLQDVVACMAWNVYDEDHFFDPRDVPNANVITSKGNQEKFQNCADHCGPWACTNLPRPVLRAEGKYSDLGEKFQDKRKSFWSDWELYQYCFMSNKADIIYDGFDLKIAAYDACAQRCAPDDPLPMSNSVTGDPYPIAQAAWVPPDMTQIKKLEKTLWLWEKDCLDGVKDDFIPLEGPIHPPLGNTIHCSQGDQVIDGCKPLHDKLNIIRECINSWGNSCEAVVRGAATQSGGQGQQYYHDDNNTPGDPSDDRGIVATLNLSTLNDTTGFCFQDWKGHDTTADIIEWARDNEKAVENLVKKLKHRHRILDYLLGEGEKALDIFGEAIDRFNEFLNNNSPMNYGPGSNDYRLEEVDINRVPKDLDGDGNTYIDPVRKREVEWWREGLLVNVAEVGDPDKWKNVYDRFHVDSPAELLIAARQEMFDEFSQGSDSGPVGNGLPSVAVYVWRGPDLSENNKRGPKTCGQITGGSCTRGYLHAVKVETRVPTRCAGHCKTKEFPWVKTRTKRWNTVRCYYLKSYEGFVKTRVIRYDEPFDNSGKSFSFANRIPILGMLLSHPDANGSGGATLFDSRTACYQHIDPVLKIVGEDLANTTGPYYLHHALMMNEPPKSGASDSYAQCWKAIHQDLLELGHHSESCVKFFWDKGREDMGLKFVSCDQAFIQGEY